MLHINDLSFRIEGRPILEPATAGIPTGHKVGLVGRNGAGKTTLLKIIAGDLAPDMGSITMPRNARIGHVAQEAPGGDESIIDWVLAADTERASLLAEAEHATDPHRIAEIHERLSDIDAHSAPARAAHILSGLGFDDEAQQRPAASSRAAGACALRSPPSCSSSRTSCCSTSRPTTSTSKARSGSRATCAPIRTPS